MLGVDDPDLAEAGPAQQGVEEVDAELADDRGAVPAGYPGGPDDDGLLAAGVHGDRVLAGPLPSMAWGPPPAWARTFPEPSRTYRDW